MFGSGPERFTRQVNKCSLKLLQKSYFFALEKILEKNFFVKKPLYFNAFKVFLLKKSSTNFDIKNV